MNIAYLLLGSNEGDRAAALAGARAAIALATGNILAASAVYETASWGKTDLPPHLNQALKIATALSAQDLLHCLQQIENSLGRVRQEKWGLRVIDIDIIFYNEDIIDSIALKIPHPYFAQRRFVLTPLAEIAPDFSDPLSKQTVGQILAQCADPLPVQRLD